MPTKVPTGAVQFVINLADGWWCAVGRDSAASGPSTGVFPALPVTKSRTPKQQAARKVRRAARKGAKAVLQLVGGKRHFEPGTVVPVREHEVTEHVRHLANGKTVRIRSHHRGPLARHYD